MREIKFRAWDKKNKKFVYLELLNNREIKVDSFEATNIESWKQYTGLKDKNGKEIYEGDIILYSDIVEPKIVEFRKGVFCYKMHEKAYHIFDETQCNIIGNIYENPKLLKQ